MIGLVTALLLAQPAPSRGDYALDPEPWNGLGYLLTTAEEAKVDLQIVPSLDLDAIAPDDTIMLLYPTVALPSDDLLQFVDSGGYLVVADDFGSAGPMLAQAGLERHARNPGAPQKSFEDDPGLPILKPSGEHFLFFNIDEVVANHPAALRLVSPSARPILSFEGGSEHLIAEVPLGSGALLAIADPSIFLNEMQRRFYGNKQLAANVLRFYCQREPCRVRLLMPGGGFSGRYDAAKHRLGTLPRDLDEAIGAIDESLADVSELLATPPWAWLVLAVTGTLALILGLLAVARFRTAVTMPIAGNLSPRGSPPALDEARGLVQQRLEADFGGMAQTLADQGLDLIKLFDLESVARDPTGPVRERQHLADAVLRVRAEAVSLQSRQPLVVSAERFLRLHADVELLARWSRGRRRVRVPPPRDVTARESAGASRR